MGNVAHDLKTPLHSIEADLEILRLVISKIPKSTIDKAVALLQSSCVEQNFDLQSIFNTMAATCQFMVMSINRSQDFMKASNNILLFPALETFDLGATISVAVTCIKHIQSDRLVVVHPFDEKLCVHLVSDKHWLVENMLCLLSNALKYSDKGQVDVNIEVIDAPIYANVPSVKLSKDIEIKSIQRIASSKGLKLDLAAYSTVSSASIKTFRKDRKKRMVLVTVEDSGIYLYLYLFDWSVWEIILYEE
jgi:signal transduction histidine kinase